MAVTRAAFMALVRAICAGDADAASRLLAASPELVSARADADVLLDEIGHYMYGGDGALHVATAVYQHTIAQTLIVAGADVHARNRRGAQPLHYAADGVPDGRSWNPGAQAAAIALLIKAGADPNATDSSGVAPLHRAVRTRCAAAVRALLEGGANANRTNKSGSTPMDLATRTTGRGGSGSPEAKTQQGEILRLLEDNGARR